MKDLSPEIKKERLNQLLIKKAECKKNFAEKFVGKSLSFLFEEEKDGYYQGYSENYLRVYLKDFNKDKNIKKVKVIEPFKDGALCEIQGE
jgi:threonylcarbamoyladenosine tRNA methylthiotransferase MtaB